MKIAHILLAACLLSTSANATLVSRLGGLAVYDTNLNITWLADAGAAGAMTWPQANTWASGLTVGGFSDWYIPHNMPHLFDQLGGTTHNANYDLFRGIQPFYYWSTDSFSSGFGFNMGSGAYHYYSDVGTGGDTFWAMAVRTGDVATAPVPAAAWLLGSGLLGLICVARRKAA